MKKAKKLKFTKNPRIYGYARVSTDDQDMSLQYAALKRYGCTHIHGEHASGKNMDRKLWQALLIPGVMRPGDTLVVWKLDRLGRSLSGLLNTIEELDKRHVHLVSLTESIDTKSAMGRFFFHIMAAMAEWERAIISERTKAGMQARIAEGKPMGRPRKIEDSPKRMAKLRKLYAQGKLVDQHGAAVLTDAEIMLALNKVDAENQLGSPQPVARMRKAGYPGVIPKDEKEASRNE